MNQSIALLGVGSTYFTRGIIESLVRVGGHWDVRMVDIDPRPLDVAMRLAKRIADLYGADIKITGSTQRSDLLSGCGVVVSTIGVGGRTSWMDDLLLGRRHGINQTTADTTGVGGLSRSLRTVPVLVDIAHDMERLCPDALFVNFSNPMSVNCRAVNRATRIKTIGLCTGVRAFHHDLARFVGEKPEDVWCTAVGVNHFTWITKLSKGTEDLLSKVAQKGKVENGVPGGKFTTELFNTFGAFPVVGDHHISEFIPNLLGKGCYYGTTLGFNGERDSAAEYFLTYDKTEADMAAQADGTIPITKKDLHDPNRQFGDEDFFAELLMALRGERDLFCTVNLPNRGQAPQLPTDSIIESTVLVNGAGFHPLCCGEISVGINAILQRIIAAQELMAEACLKSDRTLAVQSLLADLSARNLGEAEAMVDDILKTHKKWLPRFHG